MSTEHIVTFNESPCEIESKVLAALGNAGYRCEFAPGTKLLSPDSEFVAITVQDYPATNHLKPERAFLVVMETSNMCRREEAEHSRTLHLRATAGRSKLSYSLQLLIAAIVANETQSEMHDPQTDVSLRGQDAITHAIGITKRIAVRDLRETEFRGWSGA